MINDKSEGQQF